MKEQKPLTDFLSKESAFHYGYAADLIKPCCRGQKEPQEFTIHFTEKHHAIAFWEDLKKQGWKALPRNIYNMETPHEWRNTASILVTNSNYPREDYTAIVPIGCTTNEINFTLPDQWSEALDFTAKQMQLYKELQKPKSKDQQLFEYFADNHDIQLMSTDIQEIERIVKNLCQCENRTNFISNLCKKCKKYIY